MWSGRRGGCSRCRTPTAATPTRSSSRRTTRRSSRLTAARASSSACARISTRSRSSKGCWTASGSATAPTWQRRSS
ncbi:hypothetical protein NS234_16945 [Microbacterium oxydans]|nr:hypothetical protein NS234_16945 [Microbacterium oxydans]